MNPLRCIFAIVLLYVLTLIHAEHQHHEHQHHEHQHHEHQHHEHQHHEHHKSPLHPILTRLTTTVKDALTNFLTPLNTLPQEQAALTASLLTSSVTLLALPLLPLTPHLHNLLPFAAGALITDLTTHILPQTTSQTPLLLSILAFTLLDSMIRRTRPSTATAAINLTADALHNFCDGLSLGAAFLVNPSAGITTTVAIILHELPQEVADYALLLRSGFTHFRALIANFLCACTALLGTAIALYLGKGIASHVIMPFTAGGLLYLTFSSIIPDIVTEIAKPVTLDGKPIPVPLRTFLKRIFVAVMMATAGVAVITLVEAAHDH